MGEFLLSIGLFAAAHIVPPATGMRKKAVSIMGERSYLIAYSLVSVVLLVWMISAAMRAPYLALWDPAVWQFWVPLLLMPFSIWLVLAGLAEPNPLSITLAKRDAELTTGLAGQVTRHPVLWGFFLWAASHIPANGDFVALVLFGGLSLLATGGMLLVDGRARRRLGPKQWQELAAKAPVTPLLGLLTGRIKFRPTLKSLLWIALSLGLYFWTLFAAHRQLVGSDPLAGLGLQ
ncbi:MAG TPA: NnrU family protein [Devosia sp.]|nr:NnrU family protein [Devosia sp.]